MQTKRSGKVLVIGYGSELRGEDRAGRIVADRIAQWDYPRVEAISVHQPGPELAKEIAESEMTIFVDAVSAQQPIKDILQLAGVHPHQPNMEIASTAPRQRTSVVTNTMLIRLHAAEAGTSFGHSFTPSVLLSLARALYGRSPRAYMVAIPASRFELGDEFSPDTLAAIDEAVAMIKQLSLWVPRAIHRDHIHDLSVFAGRV